MRALRRWQLAALTLMSLGTLPLIGCDALQTGALPGATTSAKPALKLTILGDFAPLRTASADSRFGRIEIRGGDKLAPRVLKRADLAAALKGTKPLDGVSITNSELVVTYAELEPGDYTLAVMLYDQAEGGTKLSDNAFDKQLELGVLEAVRLDLSAAVAATVPTPTPSPAPTAAPPRGDLEARVDLLPNGDGQAHPVTLNGGLLAHFQVPTAANSSWQYEATQSVFTELGPYARTETLTLTAVSASSLRANGTIAGTLYTNRVFAPWSDFHRLLGFATLGDAALQTTGATRSFAVGAQAHVGTHYFLTTQGFEDEDATVNWPSYPLSHSIDLWYEPGVGLLASDDTVYLEDGRVMKGMSVRLKSFGQ